jgi:hypothetical protein
MKRAWILVIAAAAAIGGCGREANLQPAPGKGLPVKPLMARTTPTVDQLLTPPPYARPARIDELVKRSQPRSADPFDLPPPSGGSAPSLPAGTDPGAVTNNTSTTPGE